MIKERIVCSGLREVDWQEEHEEIINNFIADSSLRMMVAYNDGYRGFCIEHNLPTFQVEQMCYFIKNQGDKVVTAENFLKTMQYGTVRCPHIESLLRVMMGVYAPVFFENTSWPDSILWDVSNAAISH